MRFGGFDRTEQKISGALIFSNQSFALALLKSYPMRSTAEENYLKALYHAQGETQDYISNGEIARRMCARRSSVTEMLKRLHEKSLVCYEKYKGARLSPEGRREALKTIRRHRLWEVFLVEKLGYAWEEIHPIAEQLEHINAPGLSDRLDAFLNYPQCDPHGEVIPKADGSTLERKARALTSLKEGEGGRVVAIENDSREFLAYMNSLRIGIGTTLWVRCIVPYDQSRFLTIGEEERQISASAASHILLAC